MQYQKCICKPNHTNSLKRTEITSLSLNEKFYTCMIFVTLLFPINAVMTCQNDTTNVICNTKRLSI